MCSPKAQGEAPTNATAYNKGHTHWLGSVSHVQSLYVWVPAHWAPKVCEVIKTRSDWVDAQREQELQAARAWGQEADQQPQRDGAGINNATVVDGIAYFLRAVDLRPRVQDIPSLVVSIRAPWLELPISDFVNSMNTIYQGVLNGIFRQMPIAAWFRAQCKRIQLTMVLPSPLPLGEWQATLLRRTSCWPYRLPQDLPELRPPSKATFIRLRKRGQSKHILGGLVVN